MTDPTPLSPAAQAVWEAFNEDEAGVFVDYGEKLAAALRAAADHVEHAWDGFEAVDYLCGLANELDQPSS